jgi:hypothetical protein
MVERRNKVNWDSYYQKCVKAKEEAKMAKKVKVQEEKHIKRSKAAKREPNGETKGSKLLKLLSGKEVFTVAEIMTETGSAEASVKMYVSQGYLDRKNIPYTVIIAQKKGKEAYRLETKKL